MEFGDSIRPLHHAAHGPPPRSVEDLEGQSRSRPPAPKYSSRPVLASPLSY